MSSFPNLENPDECFLVLPDWVNEKHPIMPDPLKLPQPSLQFRPFSNVTAAEAAVSLLKTKFFCEQFE
jgi:hypothetical protein